MSFCNSAFLIILFFKIIILIDKIGYDIDILKRNLSISRSNLLIQLLNDDLFIVTTMNFID